MKAFVTYLTGNKVVRISPDLYLAKALLEDSENRINYHLSQKLTDQNQKYIFENCYESVREILDAYLAIKGYKSYSHRAPIVYARDQDLISHKEAILLDRIRGIRNDSRYYGTKIDGSEDHIQFLADIYPRLRGKISNLIASL